MENENKEVIGIEDFPVEAAIGDLNGRRKTKLSDQAEFRVFELALEKEDEEAELMASVITIEMEDFHALMEEKITHDLTYPVAIEDFILSFMEPHPLFKRPFGEQLFEGKGIIVALNCVELEYRNKGIGTDFLGAVLDAAQKDGCKWVYLAGVPLYEEEDGKTDGAAMDKLKQYYAAKFGFKYHKVKFPKTPEYRMAIDEGANDIFYMYKKL